MCDPRTGNHSGMIAGTWVAHLWSYTNTCSAMIAGTWVAHFCVWRKESINMFLILSENNNQQKCKIRSIATHQQRVSAIGLHLHFTKSKSTRTFGYLRIMYLPNSLLHLPFVEGCPLILFHPDPPAT